MSNSDGFFLFRARLSREQQQAILDTIRTVVKTAPLFTPTMPRSGTKFSYRMTSCGDLGWVADSRGYRYQQCHPVTNKPFPAIPEVIRKLAIALALEAGTQDFNPESCLINFYKKGEKLGLHQDTSEKNLSAPVVSISLGDSGIFLLGGKERTALTEKYLLQSGDCLVLGGESRHYFHAFRGILPNSSTLLKRGGRLNLTIRQVN